MRRPWESSGNNIFNPAPTLATVFDSLHTDPDNSSINNWQTQCIVRERVNTRSMDAIRSHQLKYYV